MNASSRSFWKHVPVAGRRSSATFSLWLAAMIAVFVNMPPLLAQPDQAPPVSKLKLPQGIRVLRDLEYIPHALELNRLNLYLPEKASGPLPVIVWIHGGGWESGSKNACPIVWMVTNGYALASIDYRFTKEAIFPAQIQDCKAAIRWLRANASVYNLDAGHICAWGHSSGGHLASLLGTTAGVKEFEGPGGNADQSSRVQAVIDWAGPSDFLTAGPKASRTKLLGGDARENKPMAIKASPITYVSKDAAPFLIMHGDRDKTVPLAQSEAFAEALNKAGAEVTFIVVKGAAHGGPKFTNAENLKRIKEFLGKHLRVSDPTAP